MTNNKSKDVEREIDLTDEELKVFDKLPQICLTKGINNKETYLQADNVFDELIKWKKALTSLEQEKDEQVNHFVLLSQERLDKIHKMEIDIKNNFNIYVKECVNNDELRKQIKELQDILNKK